MQEFLTALIISCIAFTTPAISQMGSFATSQVNKAKYQEETIYITMTDYVKNNVHYDIGITGGKLKKEMTISPEAIVVFEKFQCQRKWTFLFSGIQVAAEIIALTTKNRQLRTGLLIGGGALSGIIIPLYFGSSKNLSKAVWIRNGALLNGR